MSKVILDITMSLDGFIAGTDISINQPLGKNGLLLHNWLFKDKTETDAQLLNDIVESSGAVIAGGHTYITAIENAWGGTSPFAVPAFVLCSKVPDFKVKGFTFVTDGIHSALNKAKAIAGSKNIWVMGGANTIQQFIKAKLFDELHIHIVPLLLIQGTRLFESIGSELIELNLTKITSTPGATHMIYTMR